MAKKNKPIDSSAYGKCFAGIHINCGGEVTYSFTPTRGYSFCNKCNKSTLRGDSVEPKKQQTT